MAYFLGKMLTIANLDWCYLKKSGHDVFFLENMRVTV